MLTVAIALGYAVAAAAFYALCARTAGWVEEDTPTMPARVPLSVVEGGAGVDETRQAA